MATQEDKPPASETKQVFSKENPEDDNAEAKDEKDCATVIDTTKKELPKSDLASGEEKKSDWLWGNISEE